MSRSLLNSKTIAISQVELVNSRWSQLKLTISRFWSKFGLVFFAVATVLFIGALVASRALTTPEPISAQPEVQPLEVRGFKYGSGQADQEVIGTVKNLSSITLVAQSNGPVSTVVVKEGQAVTKGQLLVQQATAYGAGNVASVQRQISAQNFKTAEETLKNTVEVVAKNRTQAEINRENVEELRKITDASLSDTRKLITTAEQVTVKIEADIQTEQSGANNAAVIQALRQQLISFQGSLNQARASLRNAEYEVNLDNPPTDRANVQRDLVYLSTELQLKTAEINKEIASLNVQIAKIQEATTRVVAPFNGTIEKVFVQPGSYLSPGTQVAIIRGQADLCLQIGVSGALASQIDEEGMLTARIGDQDILLPISHVSSTPVNGQLYEVLAIIPSEFLNSLYEGQAIDVRLPVRIVSQSQNTYFAPLDAVFITTAGSHVFVAADGKATRKEVQTGEILGNMIEIKSGVDAGDVIILDRRVYQDQSITVFSTEPSNSVVQERG